MIVIGIAFLVCQAIAIPSQEGFAKSQDLEKVWEKFEETIREIVNNSWQNSDINKDGILSFDEWNELPPIEDKNKDGIITAYEAQEAVPTGTYSTLLGSELYRDLDVDHDFKITRIDLQKQYSRMDKDGNKVVNAEEFKTHYNKMAWTFIHGRKILHEICSTGIHDFQTVKEVCDYVHQLQESTSEI